MDRTTVDSREPPDIDFRITILAIERSFPFRKADPTKMVGFFIARHASHPDIYLYNNIIRFHHCIWHPFGSTLPRNKLKCEYDMNGLLMFLLLCGLGALCYWFFFKCVDWFGKI